MDYFFSYHCRRCGQLMKMDCLYVDTDTQPIVGDRNIGSSLSSPTYLTRLLMHFHCKQCGNRHTAPVHDMNRYCKIHVNHPPCGKFEHITVRLFTFMISPNEVGKNRRGILNAYHQVDIGYYCLCRSVHIIPFMSIQCPRITGGRILYSGSTYISNASQPTGTISSLFKNLINIMRIELGYI